MSDLSMIEEIKSATESRLIRAFSFGGGVQSTAVLALQALGKLENPYDVFLFSNVGHDSENDETLTYMENHTIPFCEEFGIQFVELRRNVRGRGEVTLLQEIYYQQRSIIIPAYFGQGGFGKRNCTTDFKVRVIDRYIRDEGYTHAIIGLGISTDEFHRARDTNWHNREGQDYDAGATGQMALPGVEQKAEKPKARRNIGFWKQREYPLLNQYISRAMCYEIIASAGLPEPPKSSCFFCPFTRPAEWVALKQRRPDRFQQAVELEAAINKKQLHLAKDGMFLHRAKRPLEDAVSDPEPTLFDMGDGCDSGHCFT